MRWVALGVALVAAGCGRSGEIVSSSSSPVADLAGAVDLARGVDLAAGGCGGGVCPPPLTCMNGQCCGGMICVPPPPSCDRQHPCPPGEQCFNGICFPVFDLGTRRDLGTPPEDLATRADLGTISDGGTIGDGGTLGDGGITSGCTNDTQCPGARCDFLTGQCVPIESCNVDRDCPTGSACVAHQCLPIQICLPFPGLPPCPPGTHCAFPPGVCAPNPYCGAGGATCPVGERCVGGYCEPDSCTSSAQCNDGYTCVGGRCQPTRYCGLFDPCPRPLRCSAHVCVP